jgi:hypothetical protein
MGLIRRAIVHLEFPIAGFLPIIPLGACITRRSGITELLASQHGSGRPGAADRGQAPCGLR